LGLVISWIITITIRLNTDDIADMHEIVNVSQTVLLKLVDNANQLSNDYHTNILVSLAARILIYFIIFLIIFCNIIKFLIFISSADSDNLR